jgi:predicted transcriptional regulator
LIVTENENILISVRPKYLESMLSGEKRVELRRRTLRINPGTHVWIYGKAPHSAVSAVATVGGIVSARPPELWRKWGNQAGVTKQEFDAYFAETSLAWAMLLDQVYALPHVVTLAALRQYSNPFHPPQFFMRLRHGSNALNLLTNSLQSANIR